MFTIVKLGGVNGSGKTSVAKAVIAAISAKEGTRKLRSGKVTKVYTGESAGVPVIVLGKYDKPCGGMDTIGDKEDRLGLVADTARKWKGIILFEGLITGKTYGAMGELSERHAKHQQGRWLYTFMDTPFDVAAARVLQRRQAAGNHAPFDPERTMRSTYTSCQHLAEKLLGDRVGRIPIPQIHTVLHLNHKRPPLSLAGTLLQRALEMHNEGF